jgi:phospholipid-binding lipoprotein MlaA
LLQFNPEIFGINLFRVFVNTTFGIFGLFDVASYLQSGKSDTSFSLTLNKYGVGSGPYIVIPFIGSTDLRSLASIPINWKIYPQNENAVFSFYQDETLYYSLYGLNILNSTVPLIKSEGAIVGDRYDFVRDSYLQHRNFLENDGQTNHDSMDDDEDDEDDEEF